jgi:gamma-D-glutamyl-L-lysine dipeptidyl-peptidase
MRKIALAGVMVAVFTAGLTVMLGATGDVALGPGVSSRISADSQRAIVNVSVATLWVKPNNLRPVDAPSASNPVNMPLWLSRMTNAERWWLVGRLQTQALYGTTVTILRRSGSWSEVAVEGQPTQLNRLGYPGWLPTRQLTTNLSLLKIEETHPVGVVTSPTAWLRNPVALASTIRLSFATRVWIVGSSGSSYLIATPAGGSLAIAKSSVAKYSSIHAIPKPTGAQIVSTAKAFQGLRYLWAGTSGFGFDCSGLTHTIYRRYGITIPRDADRQARRGTSIARANLKPGDLVFFAGAGGVGQIHHVAIYVGGGKMIHSPNPDASVVVSPITSMDSEYAGARRYL